MKIEHKLQALVYDIQSSRQKGAEDRCSDCEWSTDPLGHFAPCALSCLCVLSCSASCLCCPFPQMYWVWNRNPLYHFVPWTLSRLCVLSLSADVLGLEQFQLGHDNGGSQDVSRIMYVIFFLNCSHRHWLRNGLIPGRVHNHVGSSLPWLLTSSLVRNSHDRCRGGSQDVSKIMFVLLAVAVNISLGASQDLSRMT